MTDQQPQWVREPLAPPPHIDYAHKNGHGMLTFYQAEQLTLAINSNFVQSKQGKSYLAQHQARAELNRIFGYGNWDLTEDEPHLLYEYSENGTGNNASKLYWVAGYRMRVTITIRDLWGFEIATYTGTHAEENAKLPNRGEAHAMAITSVSSYAMRRALVNLGDRFGLGLYAGGSTNLHGGYTILLEGGQLFQWTPAGGAPQQPAAAPQQAATHETIQAQVGPDDEGTMVQQQQVQQAPQAQLTPEQARQQFVSPEVQHFGQVAQQMQQGRSEMMARVQQGMKVDGAQG